jgi:hypothetical protein
VSSGADGNEELTAHYEQLRDDVLNRSAHGFGLALFLQQGMTAWMRAWCECAHAPQTPPASAVPLAAPLPSAVRAQLTLILASMLTRPRQEAHP